MVSQSDNCGQIEFGRWRFATDAGDLTDGKSTTRLEPQVAKLTVNDNIQLSLIPTENMAAYRAFHRAMQIWEKRDGSSDTEYIQALEQTVELDPMFTRAWAELVSVLAFQNFSGHKPESTLRAE